MKRLFIIAIGLIIIAGFACKDTPPPNGTGTEAVTLSAEDISTTSVVLRFTAIPSITYDSLTITMDGKVMRILRTSSHDTLLFFEGLLPKRQYLFQSHAYDKRWLSYVSSPLSLTTMDTTSHAISWTTYELGGDVLGSLFNDVAIINDTLVYAVGELYIRDSTTGYILYNMICWNGQRWELLRVPTLIWNTSSFMYGPLQAIIAFGPDNISVTTGGQVVWYDGRNWGNWQFLFSSLNDTSFGGISMFWGISPSSLYAVGNKGNIRFYNGNTWQKMNSGTDIDLLDVWGSPDGSVVWACGWNDTNGKSVLLASSNRESTWTTIWNRPGPPFDYQSPLLSLWTSGKGEFILGAGDGVYRHSLYDLSKIRKEQLTVTSAGRNIRGTCKNDIFLAGHGGMMMHYNGYTWKSYDELLNDNDRFYGLAVSEKLVVAVGTRGPFEKALILIGRR